MGYNPFRQRTATENYQQILGKKSRYWFIPISNPEDEDLDGLKYPMILDD
jgi:hypothetical protein